MLLIIDAELSDPPSSVTCFRDTTLYASCFISADVLVECSPHNLDIYWEWLKSWGAMDFVSELIFFGEEKGVTIRKDFGGNKNVSRIDHNNISDIICFLNSYKKSGEKKY